MKYDENKHQKLAKFWETESTRNITEDLLNYDSIHAKDDLFLNRTFESSTLFFDFLQEIQGILKDKKLLFRGLSEASYRLFSKAQRNYKANERPIEYRVNDYHNLIEQLIDNAKNANDQILLKYFNAFGVKHNDVAILSFLQHYGAPTPLMDWTTDIDVALFFATSKLNDKELEKHYIERGEDIDSYFSIYILLEDIVKNYIPEFKPLSFYSKTSTNYKTIKKKRIAYISEIYKSGKPQFLVDTNFHIINQKGVFIYNNHPNLPLEEIFRQKSTMYYLHYSSIKETAIDRTPLICINVHKDVAIHIKKYLAQKGYTDAKIFPKPEEIALSAVPMLLQPHLA